MSDGDEAVWDFRLLENVGDEFARLHAKLAAGDVELGIADFDQDFRVRGRDETKKYREEPCGCDGDCWQEPPHGQV